MSLLSIRSLTNSPRISNQLYFQKRRIFMSAAFCTAFGGACWNAREWDNEILKMGVAGSLAYTIVETSFHFIDTVNIRTKASQSGVQECTRSLVNKIWAKEGVYGFGKGFSACFYGAAFSGFLNFAIYKGLKGIFKDQFGSTMDLAFCYMLAGSTAQCMTLVV